MSASTGETLRSAVFGGRFLGQSAAGADLAALVASSAPAVHLALWFGHDWLSALRQQPDPGGVLRAALDRDIARLDAKVSAQLDAVFRHPRLRRLEGSWRGLKKKRRK